MEKKNGLFSRTRARNEKRIAALGLFDKTPLNPEALRTAVLLGRCRSKTVDSHLRRVFGRKYRVLGGAGGKPLHAGPQNPTVMDLVQHGVPDDQTSIAAANTALAAASEQRRKATKLRQKVATELRRQSSRAQHQADQQAATVVPSSDSESDDDRTLRERYSPRAATLAAAPRALAAAPGGESDTEGNNNNNNDNNNGEGLRLANPAAEEAARCACAAAEEAELVSVHGKGHTGLAGYLLYRLAAVAGSGEAAPDYLFDGASGLRAQRPGFNFRNTPHPADGTKRTLLEDALQPEPPPAAESQKERKQKRQWERRQRQRKKQRTNKEAANSAYALYAQRF